METLGDRAMILVGDIEHGRMIAHKAGVGFDPEVDQVISRVTSKGNLWGGVIYTNYTKRAIQMHMAGAFPGWANLELTWLAFDYPFEQLKVEQVFGLVRSTDENVLATDKRLGFVECARLSGAVPGGDLIVLSMMRKDNKWHRFASRFAVQPQEAAA